MEIQTWLLARVRRQNALGRVCGMQSRLSVDRREEHAAPVTLLLAESLDALAVLAKRESMAGGKEESLTTKRSHQATDAKAECSEQIEATASYLDYNYVVSRDWKCPAKTIRPATSLLLAMTTK